MTKPIAFVSGDPEIGPLEDRLQTTLLTWLRRLAPATSFETDSRFIQSGVAKGDRQSTERHQQAWHIFGRQLLV